jgi:hypothetical protein
MNGSHTPYAGGGTPKRIPLEKYRKLGPIYLVMTLFTNSRVQIREARSSEVLTSVAESGILRSKNV